MCYYIHSTHVFTYLVGIDMGVVGSHVARNTAKLTMEGEYTGARVNALSNQRLLQRNR